jgi:predicted ATPase
MIDRIEFCDKHKLLIKYPSKKLHFAQGYNCITGATGSGKTILLEAIRTCKDCTVVSDGFRGKIYHYSTERQDIRTLPLVRLNPASSKEKIEKGKMLSHLSHGEGNALLFGANLKALAIKAGDTLLVDEPEAGLDVANAVEVAGAFDYLCSRKIQVIVATHHPVFVSALMNETDRVFMLGESPKQDMEVYLTDWEEAIEALRECLEEDGEIDDGEDKAVVATADNVDAACAAGSFD